MLVPALHFPGTCSQAIDLYKKALNAEVKGISYYRDAPPDSGMCTEETKDWVMHAELVIAGSPLNICDVREAVVPGNLYLFNLFLDTVEEVKAACRLMAEGGKVFEGPAPVFWSTMYADLEDRFGVHWQLMAK